MKVQTKKPEAGMEIEHSKPTSPTYNGHSASRILRGKRKTLGHCFLSGIRRILRTLKT